MVMVALRLLVRWLDNACRREREAAADLALTRTHDNIAIEHWLRRLVDHPGSDLAAVLDQTGLDRRRVIAHLDRVLDGLRSGSGRTPGFAQDPRELIQQGWLLTSVEAGAARIRSGHLRWALLADERTARRLGSDEAERLSAASLKNLAGVDRDAGFVYAVR